MSWISVNRTFVDCPYKSIQLIYPWSAPLLLTSPIGNHNSFVLKHRIILMLLSSDALHYFLSLLSINTHIRFLAAHLILWWIIIRSILHILKPSSSPLDMNWHCRVVSSTLTSVL